jgi:methyltransferase
VTAAQLLIGFVLLQRLAELLVAQRNARRLLDEGAIEHGAGHYPYFVLLHAGWLAALVLSVDFDAPMDEFWLALFVALQAGRIWVIASLGRFWTTRIITLPGAPLVRRGPYRYLRHPNYLIVAGEIAVLPLVFDKWLIAAAFSLANALLLRERIATEDAALARRREITPSGN